MILMLELHNIWFILERLVVKGKVGADCKQVYTNMHYPYQKWLSETSLYSQTLDQALQIVVKTQWHCIEV
jgi:hypothetical protein